VVPGTFIPDMGITAASLPFYTKFTLIRNTRTSPRLYSCCGSTGESSFVRIIL
jgi:hypothetical protein